MSSTIAPEPLPRLPKRVRDALRTLRLTFAEAKHILLDDSGSSDEPTVRLPKHTKRRSKKDPVAWKVVRLHIKAEIQRDRMDGHLDDYLYGVQGLDKLLCALSQCNIRHDQRDDLYKTLDRIKCHSDEQYFLFLDVWESLPETTVNALRCKANLVKREADKFWHFDDVLRTLLGRCHMTTPNKVIPVYPYPADILNEALRQWQVNCGWIAIPMVDH